MLTLTPSALKNDATLQREKEIAAAKGWHRLGLHEVRVKVPLASQDKIDLGELNASHRMMVKDYVAHRKDVLKSIKESIRKIEDEIEFHSQVLNQGYREEAQTHPVFYDYEANERVFIDIQTGEVVAREKGRLEDRQLRLA